MAVARCCLRRALASFSPRNNGPIQSPATRDVEFQRRDAISNLQQQRHSSFRSSPHVEVLNGLTDFEVFKNPPEWKHVERLLPVKTVPAPAPKPEYPSGWQPQSPDALKHPFFISRNKNHMLPVYLQRSHRGARRITLIRKIKGEIWTLGTEIRTFLEQKYNKVIPIRIHELCATLEIKGDHTIDVQNYLLTKGF